jgi:hypothetical protein
MGQADVGTARAVSAHSAMFGAILDVTGWRVPAVPAGRVGKLATALLASGASADAIRERFGTVDPGEGWWYYKADWRGKQGQRPSEAALRENCMIWDAPIAVALPEPAGFDGLRRFLERHQDADT